MIQGVLLHVTKSGGGHVWSAMEVAERKSMRDCGFSPGESILGGDGRGTSHQLYQTLLGVAAKGGVQEEGEEMQEEDDMHEEMQEEDDTHEETQEEDDAHEETPGADEHIPPHRLEDNERREVEGRGGPDPKALPGNEMRSSGEAKPEREWRRRSQEWASIMDDEQPLTFDDPQSNSDCSTLCSTVVEDVMEVHMPDSELQAL